MAVRAGRNRSVRRPTRRSAVALVLALAGCEGAPRIDLRLGVSADGSATPDWRAAVAAHRGAELEWGLRPLSADETAWLELVHARREAWEARIVELCLSFEGVSPPRALAVVVGNQNGEDGFGLGDDAIYFDLSALVRNYGSAREPANAARLERFFDHETTHVLQWRWAEQHPQPVGTPLERALWDMAREGLGNLRSLSEAWVLSGGELTPLALETLAELEPVLVERLERLARAAPEEERALTDGLSWGPFREKWGALPVALWLARESRGDDRRLRPWVEAGAAGVIDLARRHLDPALAARLPSSL